MPEPNVKLLQAIVDPGPDDRAVSPCPPAAETVPASIAVIRVPEAWLRSEGAGTRIAILSTGVDAGHPELAGAIVEAVSFVSGEPDPGDLNGAGTFHAGELAARRNVMGVIGVAPQTSVTSVKVLGAMGSGSLTDVEQALNWCLSKKFDVICLPFGGGGYVQRLDDLCRALATSGVLVVAPYKQSDGTPLYPGAYHGVLSTGASQTSQNIVADVYAPELFDCGIAPGGGFIRRPLQASLLVAGVACLVKSAFPDLSGAGIAARIISTADMVTGRPARRQVNAERAVA